MSTYNLHHELANSFVINRTGPVIGAPFFSENQSDALTFDTFNDAMTCRDEFDALGFFVEAVEVKP